MEEIIFEEITPFVEGSGDTGNTARQKIKRNFNAIKTAFTNYWTVLSNIVSKVANIENDLNGVFASNTVATQSGVEYVNTIVKTVPADTTFELSITGESSLLSNNNAINIIVFDSDGEEHALVTPGPSFPYSISTSRPYDITKFQIRRMGSNVIADGNITLSISVGDGGKFYTKDDVDAMKAQLQEETANQQTQIDNINASLLGSASIRQSVSAVVQTMYSNDVAVNIPANTNFVVSVEGDDGIIGNDLLSLQIFSESGRVLYEAINSVFYSRTFNFPVAVTRVWISRAANAIENAGTITLTVATNDSEFYNKSEVDKLVKSTFYVSPNGSDSNNGSQNSPFLTVNKALNMGANMIFVAAGKYYQQIDFSNATTNRNVTIQCTDAHNKALFRPTSEAYILATSASHYGGSSKVYSISVSGFSATINAIYQEGINDESTLIDGSERLPQQRGKKYRCENTVILKCESDNLADALAEMEASEEYRFYYASNTIYFTCPETISSNNPITFAKGLALFTNITKDFKMNVVNIDVWYMSFNLYNIGNAYIEDCSAKYVFDDGAFKWVDATSITFVRCEAARTYKTDFGDGFNGHANISGNAFAKTCVASLIDCWSHDNNDDGYSDHERAEMVIRGGLYEFNGKGGIVPAYGSHCSCYGVYSRHNYSGFYYIGNTPSNEGGMYGQMLCIDCVAENNTRGGLVSGFVTTGTYNRVTLVNCKSIGNTIGYNNGANNTMILIDCGTLNDTTATSGSITRRNTTIV